MKRSDIAASGIFVLLAAIALHGVRDVVPLRPALSDTYFTIPLLPFTEALQSVRTLGYPCFIALMRQAGWDLALYPLVQTLLLALCTAVFAAGLRAYGFTAFAAIAAASPLLWTVPTELIMPETLAKCFTIAATGFLFWTVGTRSRLAIAGLATSVFIACQMRPAFLFLLAYIPILWLFLYGRRWGKIDSKRWLNQGLATTGACVLPLLLFCLLRLVTVGHFGLVSFGGQNTIGIAVEMLRPETVQALPIEERPLAMLLARTRDGWPTERFVSPTACAEDWTATADQFSVNVNRIARTVQAKFPSINQDWNNVARDQEFSQLSRATFQTEWRQYTVWLLAAAVEGLRQSLDLFLGSQHGLAFGLDTTTSLLLLALLSGLMVTSWLAERRAFGEGTRPYSAHVSGVLLFVAVVLFTVKLTLVILVEPPIPRYVQAAMMLAPAFFSVLCWERFIILIAAGLGKPLWYRECLVAYPPIPDAPTSLRWPAYRMISLPGRRTKIGLAASSLVIVSIVLFLRLEGRNEGASPLKEAVQQGDQIAVGEALVAYLENTGTTTRGPSPLHWAAIARDDKHVVATLVEQGFGLDAPGPNGLSPVHLAALFGNDVALQCLLDSGANPNQKTMGYIAPLHLARSTNTAAVLLNAGALLDAPDSTGATAFMWAPNRPLKKFLLEQGANINATENWRSFVRQCTPLHKAVYQRDLDEAYWLLQHGADPNAGDLNNFTPLFYALWRKNDALINLLLDHGADIDHAGRWLSYNPLNPSFRFTDIYGKTLGRHPRRNTFAALVPDETSIRPIDWAAFTGSTDAIRHLVERGATLGGHNEFGMSALHWAILGFQKNTARALKKMSPTPAIFDSSTLPIADFQTNVERGEILKERN